MEKEKKRNGPTNAGTCTSVVWAHRGADRKALPPKNIIIISQSVLMATAARIPNTAEEVARQIKIWRNHKLVCQPLPGLQL